MAGPSWASFEEEADPKTLELISQAVAVVADLLVRRQQALDTAPGE